MSKAIISIDSLMRRARLLEIKTDKIKCGRVVTNFAVQNRLATARDLLKQVQDVLQYAKDCQDWFDAKKT